MVFINFDGNDPYRPLSSPLGLARLTDTAYPEPRYAKRARLNEDICLIANVGTVIDR